MELKTLKDIEFIQIPVGMDNCPAIVCGEFRLAMRKEAIKWIKAIQKAMDDSEKSYVMIGGCEFSWAYPDFEDFSSAIKILKHVHNITEEDLK